MTAIWCQTGFGRPRILRLPTMWGDTIINFYKSPAGTWWLRLPSSYDPELAAGVSRDPLIENHRWLRLHWDHEHRAWQEDWHRVILSDESRCNLGDHDGRIRVKGYAGERYLPECVIKRHSGLTPGVMVWGVISYHGRSNLLRIEANLNINRYVREVLQPGVAVFL
ncbi:transposable element Tcb1 transposase [Trichonephila clavipes]|nr:transposable element Tcb1 transposase [Trichonephila clavipes]